MKFFTRLHEQLFAIKKNYFGEIGKKRLVPSRIALQKQYLDYFGRPIDLKNPVLLSEKLNWLKLYYHDPLMTLCADKYRLRIYVERVLGKGYTPRILGVWSHADEIDFDALPNAFVLKTNHDGRPIICKDKSKLDQETVRQALFEKLTDDYYIRSREWAYKNIKRLIFAEQYLSVPGGELIDYRFFCFNGEPKYCMTTSEHTDAKCGHTDYFDLDFNHLPFGGSSQRATMTPKKPDNLAEMLEVARRLASYAAFPFVRVDMYSVTGTIYVGELTFYPTGGMVNYRPEEWNKITGDYLTLPKKNAWRHFKDRDRKWIRKALK